MIVSYPRISLHLCTFLWITIALESSYLLVNHLKVAEILFINIYRYRLL